TATTQGQQSCTPMPYEKQDNIIYKGKSSVTNGVFAFTFIVPKDINYNLDLGRVSYYAAENTQNIDASGWNESFIVGGVSSDIISDDMGPVIQLYMNDKQFVSGSITNSTPIFLAFVEDSSGINTVGNGIGHDITITLDGETSNKIILNDYYEAELDNYQKGKVEYLLNEMAPGLHTIDFKVWDVHNNSSEATLEFVVAETEDFVIEHLLNYPNPFTTNTSFYFEHNRPNQNLEVQIQIFTVSGKLVKTINSLQSNTGFRVGPISWDGRDDFQDNIARGTYIYKLKVKDMNGEFIEKLEKLVILK
ncbi:MAG: T9SS type A sorting domain-containing protein, partial [Flavobacteriales bacterium]|nr:T9SS type A sorting domain-containing protein [Flavobacteriales bacterium]